jgi:signal transduction histidine kinase
MAGGVMTRDHLQIVAIAAGLAAAIGCVGLVTAWVVRRRSMRWAFLLVALVAVLGLVAGVVGTARAMFLSEHDYDVILWVAAASGLVSLGFAVLVARLTVQGSRALQRAARAVGRQGEFVPPDNMAAELSELSHELDQALERLRESRERERSLEGARRELVTWMSHDLRTPLAGLRAMAEALEDGIAADPDRYHRQMRETVDRLTQMVDDLFEISRIHSGTLPLNLENVLLEDAVSEALAAGAPVAEARGVQLLGRAEPGAMVRADPLGLSRLIGNLVANAIRHTPTEGRVEVAARLCGDRVELEVSDECGGIPDADLTRVFDVGWRGAAARTPEANVGSGLGLAIVRGIAEAHEGSVSVANASRGCRFLVRLPG